MTTVLDRTHQERPPAEKHAGRRARLPRPKPISVNGVVIPRDEIGRETQHHPAAKPLDAWLAAARSLVVRELLLQEARRLGIAIEPLADQDERRETDEEALIRQLIEREVVTPEPDETACRRVYEQRKHNFRSSDLFAVRHILVPAAPSDVAARARARHQAEALITALDADASAFSALAAAHSACSSRHQGGTLGQISRGQTVPEFEAALPTAPVGSVMRDPVETRYGFHVVVVDHKLEGEQLPFAMVRDRIASWLEATSQEIAIRQYIAMLAGRATITGIELGSGSSPLVQ